MPAKLFDEFFAHAARLLSRRAGLHLSRVILRPVEGNPAPEPQPAVRCAVLTQGQLKRWCKDAELGLSKEQIRAACGRGEICVGAFRDGRLVAYQWLAFGEAPHVEGMWVSFAPGDCYIYRKLVLPAYRGQRIGEVLNAFANRIAAHHGRRRIVSIIDLHNRASWQSSRRSGSVTVGYVGYFSALRDPLIFITPGARREGFRLAIAPRSPEQDQLAEAA